MPAEAAAILAYNVLNDTKDAYQFGATNSTTPKTIQAIINDLKTDLSITTSLNIPFTPGFTLNNLFFDKAGAGEALSRILKPIGCHLICDCYSDLDKLTFAILGLDYTDPTNRGAIWLVSLSSVANYEGNAGTGGNHGGNIDPQNIAPEKLIVRFPIFPTPTGPSPRWSEKIENNPLSSSSGGGHHSPSTVDFLDCGDRYGT